jgi:3-methyladenine DNA glycosylase Tag
MTSKLIASVVLTAAALTSLAASAETFNPYLWDQMKAPATQTRAQVKAEMQQLPKDASATVSPSAHHGAADQQKTGTSSPEISGAAPQAKPSSVKPGGQ